MYTKLGLTKEATQLKNEVDARSNGSPVEVVRSRGRVIVVGVPEAEHHHEVIA